MQRLLFHRGVKRTAQRLAVDMNPFTRGPPDVRGPLLDAGREAGGVEPGEHPPEGVVRRDAVRQIQERSQPSQPFVAEAFDLGPARCASDCRIDRHDDHLEQVVTARSTGLLILQML